MKVASSKQHVASKIKDFTDLRAWQVAHTLVVKVYQLTRDFPKDEQYGLTSQMRRCAVSITSNIAEGFGRRWSKEKVQFYSVAQGSVTELQNQLLTSRDVGYTTQMEISVLLDLSVQVHKLLSGLIKSIAP